MVDKEKEYEYLLIQRKVLNDLLNKIRKQIKNLEDHGHRDWWHSAMCHNFNECGDNCFDGCDMPKEIWDDVVKQTYNNFLKDMKKYG